MEARPPRRRIAVDGVAAPAAVPGVYADAPCAYGHRAAAFPGGRPVAAYTADPPFSFPAVTAGQSICGGPTAAAAGPVPVPAAARAGNHSGTGERRTGGYMWAAWH